MRLFFVLCSLFSLLLSACTPTDVVVVRPTPNSQNPIADSRVVTFPDGHTIRDPFRQFWQDHGGQLILGAPLTEALPIDGMMQQYFERARLEQHADGSIVVGKIGTELLADQPTQPDPAEPRDGCQFFESTQHNLCGEFAGFWEQHGGYTVLGRPLSEATRAGDRVVQHFERARLEKRDGAITLAPLGDQALSRLPAHAVLRSSSHVAAPQAAALTSIADPVQPLQPIATTLQTDVISGTATLFWGDTIGNYWPATVEIANGQADVQHVARGGLGRQGAVIMIGGKIAAVDTDVFTLDATTAITTGQPRFDEMVGRVKAFMDQDISEYTFGPNRVRGYRSPDNNLLWLRDHVHQGKGYAYWEGDMTSLLDQFRRYQRPDGSFDDYLANFEFGEVRGRKEVEADLEYLFIEGVYRAWQATGDDAWMRRQIDAMERGLQYATSDLLRWDAEHRLVKRPYTIDTWDFEIGQPTISPDGKIAPRHWIDDQTIWAIFHGDNTGYAQAMDLLARMYDHIGNDDRAAHWRFEAQGLIDRLNALAWNGSFYTHMVPLEPVDVPGAPEQQLSLSNAYALNRDVLNHEQAVAILDEYQRRRRPSDQAFAEWYAIDPPFPAGTTSMPEWTMGHRPGEYVNGGIMPLVGGELAQGAFRWGQEGYGFDILQRYHNLIAGTNASYLWYYPIGQPGISGADTLPTDGWGSSAMLAGLIEGAAGVTDDATRFTAATIAPRWTVMPDVNDATVVVRYGASDGYVAYRWQREENSFRVEWTGSGERIRLRLLLPPDAPDAVRATLDAQQVEVMINTVGTSRYAEFDAPPSGVAILGW